MRVFNAACTPVITAWLGSGALNYTRGRPRSTGIEFDSGQNMTVGNASFLTGNAVKC